jgi:hypothetical protein
MQELGLNKKKSGTWTRSERKSGDRIIKSTLEKSRGTGVSPRLRYTPSLDRFLGFHFPGLGSWFGWWLLFCNFDVIRAGGVLTLRFAGGRLGSAILLDLFESFSSNSEIGSDFRRYR